MKVLLRWMKIFVELVGFLIGVRRVVVETYQVICSILRLNFTYGAQKVKMLIFRNFFYMQLENYQAMLWLI